MSDIEVFALDLDEEFLSHLAIPQSLQVIRAEGIGDELIEDDQVREVFHWQLDHVREHGHSASPSVLAEEFDIDFADPETAIGDLLDRMRQRWIKNEGRRKLKTLGEQFKDDPSQIGKLLTNVAREFNEKTAKRGEAFGTGDYDRAIGRYNNKVLRGPGPSLGFKALDDHFYGMMGVNFLIAPPKSYKSWIMLKALAENVENGKCGWLYSLELPAEESDMRFRCMLADVPYWKYLRNSLSSIDRDKLKEASELIDDLGEYRIVKPPAGERGIDRMVEMAQDAGADFIAFDQLQYIENKQGNSLGEMNKTGEYWQVLNRARDLSDKTPLLFAHQFNRDAMFAESMPAIQLAKGSSSIEEVATLAIGVWGNKDMRKSNVLEIGTLISRNYTFAAWELGIELSHGCSFDILGPVEDDD